MSSATVEQMRLQFKENRVGQACAVSIALAFLAAGVYVAINGHPWPGQYWADLAVVALVYRPLLAPSYAGWDRQKKTSFYPIRRWLSRCLKNAKSSVGEKANSRITYYNFIKIHGTLRCTPAMAAGVSDRLWDMSDVVRLVEERVAIDAEEKLARKAERDNALDGPALGHSRS